MLHHGPSLLKGPISHARSWWVGEDAETAPGETAANAATGNSPAPADGSIRADLVERIRREIADGTYETPEKWDIALSRLLNRLESDEENSSR